MLNFSIVIQILLNIFSTSLPMQFEPVVAIVENVGTYFDGVLVVNKSYPLSSLYDPGGLTEETQNSFNIMQKECSELGLNIYISSGYRSYLYQSNLYNRYVERDGEVAANTYSAKPGHSEHQTGLAFDLNTINDAFGYTGEGKWIKDNCHLYGFIVRYPEGKQEITGFKYEPWHLRYVGIELATHLYQNNLTLEEYFKIDSIYK